MEGTTGSRNRQANRSAAASSYARNKTARAGRLADGISDRNKYEMS
jgi:hypothetical protein